MTFQKYKPNEIRELLSVVTALRLNDVTVNEFRIQTRYSVNHENSVAR